MESVPNQILQEPLWPPLIAVVAVGGLYYALPDSLALHPRWAGIAVAIALLVPGRLAFRRGRHRLSRNLGFALLGFITFGLLRSLVALVMAIPAHVETPEALLRSAAALWATNILVFALWYWRLDAGGPHMRDREPGHSDGAFLFPAMTLDDRTRKLMKQENWSPTFVDYLFLAFNTSTALSPTDTPVLSPWAKVLMMIQSSVSLAIIALLAARAVNIL
jgi:hypothetical protein